MLIFFLPAKPSCIDKKSIVFVRCSTDFSLKYSAIKQVGRKEGKVIIIIIIIKIIIIIIITIIIIFYRKLHAVYITIDGCHSV